MDFVGDIKDRPPLRRAIEDAYRTDESVIVNMLAFAARWKPGEKVRVETAARKLVEGVRETGTSAIGLDAFLQEYELSNKEGVILMCLAEALLRVPDPDTADKLIHDKLAEADWNSHLGHSDSIFVNASTWALMLTGRVIGMEPEDLGDVGGFMKRMVRRSGEPVIRQAMLQAMKILGRQFVMGRTIDEALSRAKGDAANGYRHSFDMLGEAALTAADAARYLAAYEKAIEAVATAAAGLSVEEAPGVSVKLSALHPRYEFAQRDRVLEEITPRLLGLARLAKDAGIGLCVDAEEADRLELSLDILEAVSGDPSLRGWNGLGLALQAYQKRAYYVIDWLADLAARHDRRFMLRLVKGAYWDTEIKLAQEEGADGYPVFTRKPSTDVSYLACARKIFDYETAFFPQFATHNAHTVAAIMEYAGDNDFEFQRLHGMGEPLYDQVVNEDDTGVACRIYAPVGSHEDLLAYLVRRLLENGANTSFVNRIVDESAPISDIIRDPLESVAEFQTIPHPRIPLPAGIYGDERTNSRGTDLSDERVLRSLAQNMASFGGEWRAGDDNGARVVDVFEPRNRRAKVGQVFETDDDALESALLQAASAQFDWDRTPAIERARYLEEAADRLEEATPELLAMCVREAGKTLADAIPEVREAVDFLRYYALRCRADFTVPERLPGPTGETNELSLHGRGVFACISPWNFPLAIFLGQVSAALAAGNSVIAKPAEQTPLIAARAVDILHAAGIPKEVLHLLPGDGPSVGAPLVADERVRGVAFTGSTVTARAINMSLAGRVGPIVPLIAETGGQNAMIVDSTALPEQVVKDAVFSAFRSAGQRCSALRVLFVQDDIADKVITMLAGATEELRIGDPALIATDVGPVIDEEARRGLEDHALRMDREAKLLCRARLGNDCVDGSFFAPRAYEIERLGQLTGEVFGPILHVVRYSSDRLDKVIDEINSTGFGLTFGIHSRIETSHRYINDRLRVGNTYINRNIIGAVVGVQPFGGEGLSGTGPKAGGPRYLHRFAVERTLSINTTASGGNTSLMSLET